MKLTAREVALLDLLDDCAPDFARAHALSLQLGHAPDAMYRAALKSWPQDKIAQGNFPLLLSEDDFIECSLDTNDTKSAWGKMSTPKMIEILRSRGLPEEFVAILERDCLASIDEAAASARH